jgi:hypothetical protein
MAALFPRWTNIAARAVLLALLCLVVGLPLGLMAWVRAPNVTSQEAPVAQPVPFDHVVHAHDLQISCEYCHATVMKTASASLPPTQTCVPCHSDTWKNSKTFAPIRASLRNGTPLQWNRVNALPDFVYFNHAIHVAKGVGCETCHGRVDQMHVVQQRQPLTMGWCVQCHRFPAPNLRPQDQITTMGWHPRAGVAQVALGRELMERNHVKAPTDCSTCHR